MAPIWLPDWKVAKNYPSTASRLEWAWQFLRRNSEYQQLWAELIQPYYDPADVDASFRRAKKVQLSWYVKPARSKRATPHVPSKRVKVASDNVHFYEEMGYPEESLSRFLKEFSIRTIPPDPAQLNAKLLFAPNFIRYAEKPKWSAAANTSYEISAALEDGDVLLWFNLNWPIKPQIENAEKFLSTKVADQNERFRFQHKACQRFLRLLDAREAGASNSQIARALYPKLQKKKSNDPGKRQVRADHQRAALLRREPWRIGVGG